MPTDFQLKMMNTVHRTALKLTGGLLGWTAANMPVIELTTVGRKSGQKRSVMLTSPVQEGDAYVIVASKGGEDTHPAWFLNLRDNPEVEVTVKGRKRPMRARIASAEERERLWPQIIAKYKGYAGYQRRTAREIPVVYLEPVA